MIRCLTNIITTHPIKPIQWQCKLLKKKNPPPTFTTSQHNLIKPMNTLLQPTLFHLFNNSIYRFQFQPHNEFHSSSQIVTISIFAPFHIAIKCCTYHFSFHMKIIFKYESKYCVYNNNNNTYNHIRYLMVCTKYYI